MAATTALVGPVDDAADDPYGSDQNEASRTGRCDRERSRDSHPQSDMRQQVLHRNHSKKVPHGPKTRISDSA
jgi:hypothetical protein